MIPLPRFISRCRRPLLALVILGSSVSARSAAADELQSMIQNLEGSFSAEGETTQPERRAAAIRDSITALAALQGPDIGVFVTAGILTDFATMALQKSTQAFGSSIGDVSLHLSAPQVSLGQQEITGTISGDFSYDKLGLSGHLDLTTFFAVSGSFGAVELRPTLGSITVSQLQFKTPLPIPLPPEAIKEAVNQFLRVLATQVDGNLRPITVTIPPPAPIVFNFAAASSQIPNLTVTPATFTAPAITSGETSILITDRGLYVVMDVLVAGLDRGAPKSTAASGVGDQKPPVEPYALLKQSFSTIFQNDLGVQEDPQESVILLVNRRLAEYINYSWSLASPSATFTFDDQRQNFPGTEIRLANSPTYSCRGDHPCNVDQCSRPGGRCGWSCTHCIGGGWSKICADDPVCLSTRTACNVKEDAAVARCNADQALKKLDCERLKGQENLGCEIGKGFVDSLARLGPVGRLGGDVTGTGGAKLSGVRVQVADDMSGVVLTGTIAASAKVNVGLDFVPLNVGHVLTCPFPGKVFYNGIASITVSHRFRLSRSKSEHGFVRTKHLPRTQCI
jgi:hypothetical protein